MWQPRVIGVLVVIGAVLQSWLFFFILGAILWWNALLPRLNLFDAAYNSLIARPRGLSRLTSAPGPRRFAQGMAGTFMLAIALSLARGHTVLAWTVEGMLVAALGALIFGRFCLGSYVYHLIRGDAGFANKTLPWVGTHDPEGSEVTLIPPTSDGGA
ncbi:MAG TPA: DUF4395 family protein [Candidatus Polarisedimenticolia bacterium]|nr:DUF4395 family protein [Candidatus Polarisedimenticolia bacterium]